MTNEEGFKLTKLNESYLALQRSICCNNDDEAERIIFQSIMDDLESKKPKEYIAPTKE